MANIISGYAEGGGSMARRGSLFERAAEDLQAKLNGTKVQAIAVHSDDAGLRLIAVCDEDVSRKPAQAVTNKKGGR